MTAALSLLQAEDICQLLLHAQLHGNPQQEITGFTTDSRNIEPGNLFIALPGKICDGHDFVMQAQTAGAALVSRWVTHSTLTQIKVPDTTTALAELAQGWRQRFTLPVVLVLGSNGKTTIKEMLAAIFAQALGTTGYLATRGNYNNHIGLPLSVLRLRAEHRLAVFEIGINHPGETNFLAKIAQGQIAVISNAQREHQEFMKDVATVAHEHGLALQHLPENGVAILPAHSPYFPHWVQQLQGRKFFSFALNSDKADISGRCLQALPQGQIIAVQTPKGKFDLHLQALGQHNAENALAACAAALAAGVDLDVVQKGLAGFLPVGGRLQIQILPHATIINDTYNANPDSMRAAIAVLAQMPRPQTFIAGDMGEVGLQGKAFHREIGDYARAQKLDRLLTVGSFSLQTSQAFGMNAQHFLTLPQLTTYLLENPLSGSILVKGSRFMQMEKILPTLIGEG